MTEPVENNPYGVHVPGSGRILPGVVPPPTDDHPLVPWEEPRHTHQWVDVDHAAEQLARFQHALAQLAELVTPGVDKGRLVIVSGPRGMGKTSLIHRCIHQASQHIGELSAAARLVPGAPGAATPSVPKHIVAMTAGYRNEGSSISVDENGDFAATPVINANIRDKIYATLCRNFEDVEIDPAIAAEPPLKAFSGISTLLTKQDALLFAVIPHIDWKDATVRTKFLKTCLSHAQTRIVLFVEVSHETNETADAVAAELSSSAVTHLALGRLTPEDILKFSLSGRPGHPQSLPPAARDELMTAHTVWHPADVRELRQVFYAAAEHRGHDGATTPITADELSRHWSGRGPDIANMRRDPPDPPDPPTGS